MTCPPRFALTISVLVEKAEGLLEFSNLFFGKLIGHGAMMTVCWCCCVRALWIRIRIVYEWRRRIPTGSSGPTVISAMTVAGHSEYCLYDMIRNQRLTKFFGGSIFRLSILVRSGAA